MAVVKSLILYSRHCWSEESSWKSKEILGVLVLHEAPLRGSPTVSRSDVPPADTIETKVLSWRREQDMLRNGSADLCQIRCCRSS